MAIYELDGIRPALPEPGRYWVAPSAAVIGKVEIGIDGSVWFGAVLRGDHEPIIIGAGSNVQDGCVIHTDPGMPATVGRNCTIGHRAILHSCAVGDNTLIGMGATVLNRAQVGRNCLIGANALIPEGKAIPDQSLVIGMPGRIVRQLTAEEVEALAQSARNYIANWKRFAATVVHSDKSGAGSGWG
ncbi:MAG: gamma carbonic anhydrase family protein [Pseudomonadota bacterium]|nr:gamma carbonic anhydrase family protein [Pseudomonadota bacterium]